MNLLRTILLVLGVSGLLAGSGLRAESAAARIILLANEADPDSVRIARHYAVARGVPLENIIALPMPQTETIGWPEFVTTVWQPLQDELIRRKWIDAIPMALVDEAGRKKSVINGHRISYLVVCRGVPLRVYRSSTLEALLGPRPPPFNRAELRTTEGAVDSELSLLAAPNYPIAGFVPNPLFHNDAPLAAVQAGVVKVSRLDGPTVEDAMGLVDQALAAERTGLLGRAYVDIANKFPLGDGWLKSAAAQLTTFGFDLDVDRASATLPVTARFDAPVFYFGWYAGDVVGPFTLPGFRFPPGAVAVHIHSFSATTLRSGTAGWCGPFVARGVTATVGNVFEPYLDFLHRPDLLLSALARGETFGDAAYYAEPALSWQSIAIGDPLYRPFARAFEEQWKDRANLPPELAGYAALRKMHLLEMQQQASAAVATANAALQTQPNLALGFALARQRELAGDLKGATEALAFTRGLELLRPDEWVLAVEAARLLARTGAREMSADLYRRVLQDPLLPPDLQQLWQGELDGGKPAGASSATPTK